MKACSARTSADITVSPSPSTRRRKLTACRFSVGWSRQRSKSPPYERIQRHQDRYIDSMYLPEGITLCDPRRHETAGHIGGNEAHCGPASGQQTGQKFSDSNRCVRHGRHATRSSVNRPIIQVMSRRNRTSLLLNVRDR